jgi:hypothetical protein
MHGTGPAPGSRPGARRPARWPRLAAERVQRGGGDLLFEASGRAWSQARSTCPERPSTRSSSRAGRPGVRSTMPVANRVGRPARARRQRCSSTPIAVTPSRRAGSSMTGLPRSWTCRLIVAQPTPNPRACPATVAPRATASTPAAAARSVSTARGGIAGWVWSPGLLVTPLVGAAPDAQDRAQHHRPARDRQVRDPGRAPVLRGGHRPTARTAHQPAGGLDHDLELAAGIGRGQHLEPVNPNSTVSGAGASRSTWGPPRST